MKYLKLYEELRKDYRDKKYVICKVNQTYDLFKIKSIQFGTSGVIFDKPAIGNKELVKKWLATFIYRDNELVVDMSDPMYDFNTDAVLHDSDFDKYIIYGSNDFKECERKLKMLIKIKNYNLNFLTESNKFKVGDYVSAYDKVFIIDNVIDDDFYDIKSIDPDDKDYGPISCNDDDVEFATEEDFNKIKFYMNIKKCAKYMEESVNMKSRDNDYIEWGKDINENLDLVKYRFLFDRNESPSEDDYILKFMRFLDKNNIKYRSVNTKAYHDSTRTIFFDLTKDEIEKYCKLYDKNMKFKNYRLR